MNSIFHGIDIVSLSEFKHVLHVDDGAEKSRMFNSVELSQLAQHPQRLQKLAGRFAAKEAVLKALGTGFGTGICLSDLVIVRADGDAPTIELVGSAKKVADELNIGEWKLSISYGGDTAMASVVALARGE